MSAYICDRKHIVYLVASAISHRISSRFSAFRWYHDGSSHELPSTDYERAAEVANMLWRENIASVGHRYGGSSSNLPGPVGERFEITAADIRPAVDVDPVQVLKSVNCYEYQTCEHDGWKASEAKAFCDSLTAAAIRSLPGYESAEWGAPADRPARPVSVRAAAPVLTPAQRAWQTRRAKGGAR